MGNYGPKLDKTRPTLDRFGIEQGGQDGTVARGTMSLGW
jgi:hypothetical protein